MEYCYLASSLSAPSNQITGIYEHGDNPSRNSDFKTPTGSGGDGFLGGGGTLGGLLIGALLGNRGGLFGGNNNVDGGVVTPAMLEASLARQSESTNTNAIMQSLGDIKAAVPLAESQVQLALAGAQAELAGQINASQIALMQGQAGITANITAASTANLVGQGDIKLQSANQAAAILAAIKESQYQLASTTRDDGDKTRALVESINNTNLNRELAVAQGALIEQRAVTRSREIEVNVAQTVNQNQVQAQAQAQAQQQTNLILSALQGLASQLNRSQQDIIAVGSKLYGVDQNSANTNVR